MARQFLSQSGASQAQQPLGHPNLSHQHFDPRREYTTAEIGARLFSHAKHPSWCAWHWIVTEQIPTTRVGIRIRVLGQSLIDAKRDKERAIRRGKTQLRRVS